VAGATLALFALLLLVPSANVHVFDGLPLSTLPELVGLVLLLLLFAVVMYNDIMRYFIR